MSVRRSNNALGIITTRLRPRNWQSVRACHGGCIQTRAVRSDQIQRGFSIPDQLARLRADARAAGEIVVAEFIDQARSGTSAAKRADYQALLTAARLQAFDRVRVESVDRGHRNDTDRHAFEAEMQSLGIRVFYSGETEQQAPQYRKFNRGIRGVVAELEADETSDRTYKRHLYRAKQGKWRGGNIPYDLLPDGNGWFHPDPATYPALCWILERRADGLGYHRITALLNAGIQLADGPRQVPATPALCQYQRKPYREWQDPETGAIEHHDRTLPDPSWKTHAVEFATQAGMAEGPAAQNHFLLAHLLRCGSCGRAMHGYTTSKYKNGTCYKYRKYRCAGRTNRAGACTMTILGAEPIERLVVEAVFAATAQTAPSVLLAALTTAVAQRRSDLTAALDLITARLAEVTKRCDAALDLLMDDPTLAGSLRQAVTTRIEVLTHEIASLTEQHGLLRTGLATLDAQARGVEGILRSPDLDPARWQEARVRTALQRALHVIVRRVEIGKVASRDYTLRIWLPDAENLQFSEFGAFESACLR